MSQLPNLEADFSRQEEEVKLESDSLSGHSLFTPSTCDEPTQIPCLEQMVTNVLPEVPILMPISSRPPLIKRGYRDMTSTLTCGALFQSDPVWLWCLRPNSWSKIYLTVQDEARLRQDHPVLFEKLQSKIFVIPTTFAGDYPRMRPNVMMISGSKCFIEVVTLPPLGRHLYWLAKAGRRTPTNSATINWTRILHRNVGGATNARGTFGIDVGSGEISLEKDVLRTIGHVLKYSVRPMACNSDPQCEHYTRSDSLSLSFPRRPVLYPTYMTISGWGLRKLTEEELSACFELPVYLSWSDRYIRDILPLHMFRSVLDSVLDTTSPEPPRTKAKLEEIKKVRVHLFLRMLLGSPR